MASKVAIVGVGMVAVGRSAVPSWELFAQAARAAIDDSGIDSGRIRALHLGNVYSSYTEGQTNTAPLALSTLGLGHRVESTRYETACASSSVAFRQAFFGIASGACDVVLVGGMERLRSIPGAAVQQAMASSMDVAEREAGLTFPAYWAAVAKAYAAKHGLGEEALAELLAHVTVKNHYHGAANRFAQLREEATLDAVEHSPTVCAPIRIMDCCPFSDGAAALVLASEALARRCAKPVWVVGTGQASGPFAVAGRSDLAASPAIEHAARAAYSQARIGAADVEVAEVHDCVNIHEVMCLEAAGLFRPGEAVRAARERRTYAGGELPVNLSGGLKSRGHPVGATGAYQLAEMTQILRGDFEGRPTRPATTGITVNVGGTGTVATVNVLRRE